MIDYNIKYFVDTNVLVYAFDNSNRDKYNIAINLMKSLWGNRNGTLSIQVLQEFYVIVTKKISNPTSPERAIQIIRGLKAWDIHKPVVDDIIEAIKIQNRYKISFWDSMIIRSAKARKCDILYSEDLNHLQVYEDIKVVNPFLNNTTKK